MCCHVKQKGGESAVAIASAKLVNLLQFAPLTFSFFIHHILGQTKFKQSALEHMEVSFKTGRTSTRQEEILMKIVPAEMFVDAPDIVGFDNLVLEVKTGDDCWKKVNGFPGRR